MYTCHPICRHFLRRQISDKRPYFLHNPQNCLRIVMNLPVFQPKMHPSVAIGIQAVPLFLFEYLCRLCVFGWTVSLRWRNFIRSASGYGEEPAHDGYGILFLMAAGDTVFFFGLSFLPIDRRKSRKSLFSSFSLLFSYWYFCGIFAGFLPRCFGEAGRFSQLWITYLPMPSSQLNVR